MHRLCLHSGWSFALCITSCSQQWWLIYDLQSILDCFPVSVSTEPIGIYWTTLQHIQCSTVMTSLFTATRIHINCISVSVIYMFCLCVIYYSCESFYIFVNIPGMWFCQNHNVLDKMLYMMRCERIYFLPNDFDHEGNNTDLLINL